ncbi:Tn3 family transposase [Streptomyces sp. NPDC005056]
MHADTQGQSFPVFGLAYLLGIDLPPRIRNFHDLTFHRPHPQVRYQHIDALFSTDPRAAIKWGLIESEWPTLVRVAMSVKEGSVSSVTLLRRLNPARAACDAMAVMRGQAPPRRHRRGGEDGQERARRTGLGLGHQDGRARLLPSAAC